MQGKSQMSRCSGPFKSMFLQIFTGICLYEGDPNYDLSSNDWHVVYREPPDSLGAIVNRVIELCKHDVTHELFGLTYVDIMNMTYTEFSRIRKVVYELAKQKQETIKSLQNEIKPDKS